MKKAIRCISFLLLMCLLQSHEFWMTPTKFKVKAGEELAVSFMVGENFTGQAWDVAKGVEKIQLFEKGQAKDLKPNMPGAKGGKLKIAMANPGTKMVALISQPAFIELDAEKFNQYLTEDGLEEVADWRSKNGQENSSARELYTRYSKLIVQVDGLLDDTWRKQVGHKLEIIPDQNPGAIKSGDYMGCQVLYQGKPMPHILVKVWGHVGNRIFLQNIYSENDGTIKFPISASGPWMVSAVKMEKSKKPEADWESSWASLVFNVE
jgi:uncharacterized GH25 family protein